MQAFPATVLHVYQVNDKTVPPGESQVMNGKDWGYVLRSEPQTLRQHPNFYQYHSCNIQQAGGNIEIKTRIKKHILLSRHN